MKKFAVVLSGCGVMDGSEIHEAVACILALDRAGVEYQCIAPNIPQTQVINHLTNEKMVESRNVLVESARIARGNVQDIRNVDPSEFSGAIYPGGFGAALNLSTFATDGAKHKIQPEILRFAEAMAKAHKPQGFTCIAPVMIAKIYGAGVHMTIGSDPETIQVMEEMGNQHEIAKATECVLDTKHKVVSTPAYMNAKNIREVFEGIEALVKQVIVMA